MMLMSSSSGLAELRVMPQNDLGNVMSMHTVQLPVSFMCMSPLVLLLSKQRNA